MAGGDQLKSFCRMWADKLGAYLALRGVPNAAVAASDPVSTPAPTSQEFEKLVCIRFSGGAAIKGELLWVAEKPAAIQIAQFLSGAASDDATDLSGEARQAYVEFLSQAANQTAASWKAEFGSEIELIHQVTAEPAPVTAQCVTVRLSGEKFPEVSLRLFLNGDLSDALVSLPVAPPLAEQRAASASPPKSSGSAPAPRSESLPANLGLVLDVALEATIRFGDREMLLRDIFALMAGAVVELNQMVNEPAELHVAGRLVARGEVVVVDGNFGLRVTEVATLNERVAAIPL